MVEIIPFPVWIIPFPVFKTSFKLVDKIQKHFVKEFFIKGQKLGDLIPFPVFKTSFGLNVKN